MLKFTRTLIQTAKCNTLNNYGRICFSIAPTAELKNFVQGSSELKKQNDKKQSSIVAAAFASLNRDPDINTPVMDSRITSATSVDELLSLSAGNGVTRKHALKVVSILAQWSSSGKVVLPDFETDPRFLKLCRILSRTTPKASTKSNVLNRSEDLSTILGITADDEAARLVANITLPQMVKVMTSLSQKKRRSMMLLRALAFNITKSTETLDLKKCGDLLYGMAVLNFPDENLLEKVCFDICKGINDDIEKSSIFGSILTSLGLLKYKDSGVLEAASKWMVKHSNGCRAHDIFALFQTLAVLHYEPSDSEKLYSTLVNLVSHSDALRPSVWLEFVWSLVLLNKATSDHLSSVLSEEFLNKIQDENSLNIGNKLKLLNIDAAAEYLTKDYNGPRLGNDSDMNKIELSRSKDKEVMCLSIIECLKNLASEKCFKSRVNSGMGFFIDAELVLDKKCTPVPFDAQITPDHKRVAIVAFQYQDMCKGTNDPTGLSELKIKLLNSKGYHTLSVPYTEYRTWDKLVDRVKYLEKKLRTIVQ